MLLSVSGVEQWGWALSLAMAATGAAVAAPEIKQKRGRLRVEKEDVGWRLGFFNAKIWAPYLE